MQALISLVITVHPHVCGEHCTTCIFSSSSSGSSPRMWGTPGFLRCGGVNGRFIPTYVGNTSSFFPNIIAPSVHPHVCGEHTNSWNASSCMAGSSPRMWGTRFAKPWTRLTCGSSPRMWGTHTQDVGSVEPVRFIPTYVGNTQNKVVPISENDGSSPRMWGTLLKGIKQITYRRFIPTYVGNTSSRRLKNGMSSVHPHVCGEHSCFNPLFLRQFSKSSISTNKIIIKKTQSSRGIVSPFFGQK